MYRDRIDRERSAATTRRAAGREIKAPDKYDPSEEIKKRGTAAELKAVQVSPADFHSLSLADLPSLSLTDFPFLESSSQSLADYIDMSPAIFPPLSFAEFPFVSPKNFS